MYCTGDLLRLLIHGLASIFGVGALQITSGNWEEDRNGEGVLRVYWRQAERIVLFLLLAVDELDLFSFLK